MRGAGGWGHSVWGIERGFLIKLDTFRLNTEFISVEDGFAFVSFGAEVTILGSFIRVL